MKYTIDAEKVVWRFIDNEAVVLNLVSGHYYGLNKTSSLIWRLLNEEQTAEQIAARIEEKYGISRQKAHQRAGQCSPAS